MGTHPIFESDFDCLQRKLQFLTMIIYKDIFSNDELASDTYKCTIIDDVILEIECKMITCKPGAIDEALLGANASAEGGGDEGGDEETITAPNLVLAHRLQTTGFDKKGWTVYIKDYMKRTLKKLEESKPDRAAAFKAGAQTAVKKIRMHRDGTRDGNVRETFLRFYVSFPNAGADGIGIAVCQVSSGTARF